MVTVWDGNQKAANRSEHDEQVKKIAAAIAGTSDADINAIGEAVIFLLKNQKRLMEQAGLTDAFVENA